MLRPLPATAHHYQHHADPLSSGLWRQRFFGLVDGGISRRDDPSTPLPCIHWGHSGADRGPLWEKFMPRSTSHCPMAGSASAKWCCLTAQPHPANSYGCDCLLALVLITTSSICVVKPNCHMSCGTFVCDLLSSRCVDVYVCEKSKHTAIFETNTFTGSLKTNI